MRDDVNTASRLLAQGLLDVANPDRRAGLTKAKAEKRPGSTHKNALQDAFLEALADRVDRGGRVTLPVGNVDCDELARVLRAIDHAKAEGDR